MRRVRRFFSSLGFATPRSVANITENGLNKILESPEGSQHFAANDIRFQTCCHQVVIMATDLSKHQGRTGKVAADQEVWGNNNGKVSFDNNTMSFLKMLGPNPMAHMVMNTANAIKVTPNMIPEIMQEYAICEDIGRLAIEFTPSTDVFSLFMTENIAADKAGRQALSYWILTDDSFTAPWLPPEKIGGLVTFLKDDLMLAADENRKDALSLVNGLSKTWDKMRFFRSREHWMMAWTRAMPIFLTSGQWTFTSWLTHFNHICMLYERNSEAGNDHLITWYEDQVRKYWSLQCARGIRIDLVEVCGMTNKVVMDNCKAKIHHLLAATGLPPSQARQHHTTDVAANAMAKQQAMIDADTKRQLNLANATDQRLRSFETKVDALIQQRPAQSNREWSSKKPKARGKGKSKGGQPKGKGKKVKAKKKSSWNKVDLKANKDEKRW